MEKIVLHATDGHADWMAWQQPQVVILGHFDGIHAGHMKVIERGLQYGREHGLPVALMTFHPHPKAVFGDERYTRYLTPPKEKERILAQFGIDRLYIIDFNLSFAQVKARTFADCLCALGVKHAVVGFDNRFGHRGEGSAELLAEWGEGCFTVDIVPAHNEDDAKVSSTRIRQCLAEGDIAKANQLLARPYLLRGTVIHGDARGRTIGFPTANVDLDEPYVIPRNGVYAVKVKVGGKWHDGVMNIGLKPTFKSGETRPSIEAHLFAFDADIYGEEVTVAVMDFLRAEQKFDGIAALVAQITADAEEARRRLASIAGEPALESVFQG
ncbi:bifunctional riboflavin kinase/FAD synthetase [Paenibacillus dendritiformis]|uniref:bifunctional riboflavin kinase/FAD synthetase n=1 Tax=Paenibacillus dendritiformis TaxID=130049 RepID=UPI0018CF7ADA|nr:bifunctional riboflavin kinase/FAD synthetase [Paenibacillus dendritiformis]